jgi:tetratricopeptide (TPR) repeat protein
MKCSAAQGAPSAFAPQIANAIDQDAFQRWYAEGDSLANGGHYDRALRCFEEASILDPNNADALVYQAVCLIHLEQPQPALTVAEQVLAIAPDHPQGWLYRGVALHRLGRYKAAYASYARVQPA